MLQFCSSMDIPMVCLVANWPQGSRIRDAQYPLCFDKQTHLYSWLFLVWNQALDVSFLHKKKLKIEFVRFLFKWWVLKGEKGEQRNTNHYSNGMSHLGLIPLFVSKKSIRGHYILSRSCGVNIQINHSFQLHVIYLDYLLQTETFNFMQNDISVCSHFCNSHETLLFCTGRTQIISL